MFGLRSFFKLAIGDAIELDKNAFCDQNANNCIANDGNKCLVDTLNCPKQAKAQNGKIYT